jgi:hypothetical protein
MRETQQQQSGSVASAQPAPVAPGKQTLSAQPAPVAPGEQALFDQDADDGGDASAGADGNLGGAMSPAAGQRAGDWGMTPALASAMGLGTGGPAGAPGIDGPSGRHQKTDFGEYWVIPDDANPDQCIFDSKGEIIADKEFATAQKVWKSIQGGSGKLKILETDLNGKATAGFKATMQPKVGLLMSRPKGRELMLGLAAGAHDVTIRPSTGKINGGAQARRGGDGSLEKADGKAGVGSSTTVEIDPTCSDDDNKVYDKDGNEISDPVYIFLGHELIHARHNQEGGTAATWPPRTTSIRIAKKKRPSPPAPA